MRSHFGWLRMTYAIGRRLVPCYGLRFEPKVHANLDEALELAKTSVSRPLTYQPATTLAPAFDVPGARLSAMT